jgi:hypothetical protein
VGQGLHEGARRTVERVFCGVPIVPLHSFVHAVSLSAP